MTSYKKICIKDNILLELCKPKRLYRLKFNIEMNENDYMLLIFENVVKKNIYNLLHTLNKDLIHEIKVLNTNDQQDDILFTYLIDLIENKIEYKNIYFTNTTIIENNYNLKLIGTTTSSVHEIDNINITFTYTNDKLEVELSFNNTGKLKNDFFENINAFFFKKIVKRLKTYLINNKTS
jgi:hypothetical protein